MKKQLHITELFSTINTYLSDIIEIHNDERQLKECFVDIYPRNFDENSIASYAFNIPAIAFLDKNKKFRELAIEKSEIFSSALNINPIFFYAYVGQGKTTYLKHLLNIRLKEDAKFSQLKMNTYFIYLAYTETDPNCKFIREDYLDKLELIVETILNEHKIKLNYEHLCEIFPAENLRYKRRNPTVITEKFREFILDSKDNESYLRAIIKWFGEKRKIKICCIVDNIDQHFRFLEGVEKYIELFQFIRSFSIQLIIPLRVSNKGIQNDKHFDAYTTIPITLSLPDYGELMARRIQYLEKHLIEELKTPTWMISDDTYIETNEVMDTLHSISNLINKNDDLQKSLLQLSNYIVRDYLGIVANNLISTPLLYHPFTNDKIDYKEKVKLGKFHSMFIYSLMLRNNKTHREYESEIPIINLFDNKTVNNWTAFCRFQILLFLNQTSGLVVHVKTFIEDFQKKYKIDKSAIKKALEIMINKKCVRYMTEDHFEKSNIAKMIEEEDFFVKISPRGIYHLDLAKELEYYEILAIPKLLRQYKEIQFTTKKIRASNLKEFLNELKDAENLAKEYSCNPELFIDSLQWSNTYYPIIIEEYKKAYGEYET